MDHFTADERPLLRARAAQFRDQVRRHLAGELSDEAFLPLRLRNGLYKERHSYMLRLAIPYGDLTSDQLRALGQVARRYDRGYGHFTTRQQIQFNWVELAQVPDLLEGLAEAGLHSIHTSGAVVRNITVDPFAGVTADEVADPRPYAEIIRRWSLERPEFHWLPKKFKIAISGSPDDRAATAVHDLGLRIVYSEIGEPGFRVVVGGGLGRAPALAQTLREFLPQRDLLGYLAALLRTYNRLGRRDNPQKGRIKILVQHLGIDALRAAVESEWHASRDQEPPLEDATVAAVAARFSDLPFEPRPESRRAVASSGHVNAFNAWRRNNTRAHRVAGYRVVTLALKHPGRAPGDITEEQLAAAADLADRYSFGRARVIQTQNLLLPHVAESDLFSLWLELRRYDLASASAGTLADVICCPGRDYCELGHAKSIVVAQEIQARFADLDYLHDLGELRLNISGCVNACGHHHIGHIGVLGLEKGGEPHYQIVIGGDGNEAPALGERLGPALGREAVVDAVAALIDVYVEQRVDGERFIDTVRRIGREPFRAGVYATPPRAARRPARLAAAG